MPSTNDDSPPEPLDACLAAILCYAPAIAGAIIFTHDLSMHTRLPEGRYPVLVLSFTYGVLPSAGATLGFAYPEFEWRRVDRRGPERGVSPEPLSEALQRSLALTTSKINDLRRNTPLQFADDAAVPVPCPFRSLTELASAQRKSTYGAAARRMPCPSCRSPVVGASPCSQQLGSRSGF